jgi:hypothetical protein
VRPLRISASVVLSPVFNNFITKLENRGGFSKSVATGIVVFLVNVVGTISYLVFGLLFATKIFNVPLLP